MLNFLFNRKASITNTSIDNEVEHNLASGLSYRDIQDLYLQCPIANRIVNLPTKLALYGINISSENISNLEDIVNIDDILTITEQYVNMCRLYGIAVLLPITQEDNISNPLLKAQIFNEEIRYNIIEPLNMSYNIDQNPSSFSYRKAVDIIINGKPVNPNRILMLTNNNLNLALQFNRSALGFVGQSVLFPTFSLLKLYMTIVVALERQLMNSSVLILQNVGDESISSNLTNNQLKEAMITMKNIKQNSVVLLKNNLQVSQFQLTNLSDIQNAFNSIIEQISLSLPDIPKVIFSSESLSSAFNEGSQELELLNIYLNNIRINYINPTIKFILTYELYSKLKDKRLIESILDTLQFNYEINTISKSDILENIKDISESVNPESGNGSLFG